MKASPSLQDVIQPEQAVRLHRHKKGGNCMRVLAARIDDMQNEEQSAIGAMKPTMSKNGEQDAGSEQEGGWVPT